MECFDVAGAFRDQYRSLGEGELEKGIGHNGNRFRFRVAKLVDPTGVLPDGRAFSGISEFKRLLENDVEQVARNLVQTTVVSMAPGRTSIFRIANK